MATGTLMAVALAALLALGGGAYLLLANSTGGAVVLSGDGACSRLAVTGPHRPTGEPDRSVVIPLEDGEPFHVERWAGLWHGRMEAENASFASIGPRGAGAEPRWMQATDFGWCYQRSSLQAFLARGNGTLTLTAWAGEGHGFTAG